MTSLFGGIQKYNYVRNQASINSAKSGLKNETSRVIFFSF